LNKKIDQILIGDNVGQKVTFLTSFRSHFVVILASFWHQSTFWKILFIFSFNKQ